MTTIRFIATTCIVMIAGLLNSCIMHDDLDDCPANKQLKVKATIETDNIGNGNIKWPEGSIIGITVFKAGADECFGDNFDKKYNISNSSTGESDPDNENTSIYLPDDGSTSDIIAYYPYSIPFDRTFTAPLSVANQSIPDSLDLITSDRECNIRPDTELIHLKFYRRLTKIVFNIKLIAVAADGTETIINEQLPGTRLDIEGLPTEGNYFLPDNKLTTGTTPQTISSIINKEGTKAAAIVFPRNPGEGVSFLVTLPDGSKHTKLFSPEQALQAGMENLFDVVIKIKKDVPVDPKPEYKITYELQGGLTPDNIAVKQGSDNAPWSLNQTIVAKQGSSFSFLYNSTLTVTARLADGTVLNTQNNIPYPFANINKDIHIILSTAGDPEPPDPPIDPADPVDPEYKVTYELQGDLTMSNITVRQGAGIWENNQIITVKEGDNFNFSYNSALTVSVSLSDGTALSMNNNTPYTFTNIKKDIHIILNGKKNDIPVPQPKTHKVTYLLEGSLTANNITVTQGSNNNPWASDRYVSVQDKGEFTFQFTTSETVTVRLSDGTFLTMASGTSHTVTNITKDVEIIISSKPSHTVYFKYDEGILINREDENKVIDGADFIFKPSVPNPDPYIPGTIVVTLGGKELSPKPDGSYTVSNIQEDKHLEIIIRPNVPDTTIKADVHVWEENYTIDGGIITPKSNK